MSTWHAGHPDERAPLPTARPLPQARAVAVPPPWRLRLAMLAMQGRAEARGLLLLVLGALGIVASMASAPLLGSAAVLVIGLVAGSVALAVGWEAVTRKH